MEDEEKQEVAEPEPLFLEWLTRQHISVPSSAIEGKWLPYAATPAAKV